MLYCIHHRKAGELSMAIDVLQNKIKKCGCVLMVDLTISEADVPAVVLDAAGDSSNACFLYAKQLLEELKGIVPAVKFRFFPFALSGADGLEHLSRLLTLSHSLGYYTLLEVSGVSSPEEAVLAASKLWGEETAYPCDAIQISGFYGSDIIKPFLSAVEDSKKDLFITARTSSKSSAEIQDLLSGSRTVHMAVADNVNRYGISTVGKYGFSRVGIAASAYSADSLRLLRTKYQKLFILIDGWELPSANAKNCSVAFNNLGHGAAVIVGSEITQAWKESADTQDDYAATVLSAVKKVQKKLERYVTVL